ncbi:A-kinase anchor protein 12b isoform X2 [Antennarius striatus]|uniref:A-kinase anchor protein 12b isoform X2 n=1 Tax=Antennarius striatus TaxID=241820 RepID=UPI0035AE3F17
MLGTITLTVGQPDGVSVAQKEEASENMDTIQDEVAPQVNVEKESPDVGDISVVEEKAAEEKPDDTNEVGFKKIFRFVGFKFTLKKDKSEEKDPVKLLTVKDKEGEEVSKANELTKEEEVVTVEEKSTAEKIEVDSEASTVKAEVNGDADKAETADAPAEDTAIEVIDEKVKEGETEKETETTQPVQETTLSSFRKLFNGGLFSNLRKKASIKKTKDEEDKETAVEEETVKLEETSATVEEKVEKDEVEQEPKEAVPVTTVEEETEPKEATLEVVKSETDSSVMAETPAETPAETTTTEEPKQEKAKAEACAEEEKAPAVVLVEPELLSSQEKSKPQGSPLKKLFTGAGLKKLSTKKQKTKKDNESKLTESGEQVTEQLQSSSDSADAPKAESGPSSPEDSGEHVIAVAVPQTESSQETDVEVASDGEKKKEGIIAWSSFKKLVTPKRRVKRSSESDDEATSEKPAKTATLSSSESAALADKSVEEETKEDKPTEEEPKTENTEKLLSSTEEPKKKMDTSVSWEALMCMGGPKKRTRKTSDSDDEETKIEEELQAPVEEEVESKTEAAIETSQNAECEGEVSPPEPASSPQERESAWDTLKRMVMPKNKAKSEEKPEESTEQVQSDSEAPKDESSFSLKKFLPGRRKKKSEKQASAEQGSGEEDSDTPAVVPLSEYNEQPVEAEQETPTEPAVDVVAEPAVVQTKLSAEERSPSWIPAIVEDTDHKLDDLSDIPEEAENAVTPKSVDTDITEEEIKSESLDAIEQKLSIAEVKPVIAAAEATPVPQEPTPESVTKIIEDIEVSEIPTKITVTTDDVPTQVVSEKTECLLEAESKTNIILESHSCEDAVAICTGLETKDIAEIATEEPVIPIIESVGVMCDTISTNVPEVEPQPSPEEAIVTEDVVVMTQVQQSETIVVESTVETSLGEVMDIQEASENCEAEIETAMIDITEENELITHVTIPSQEVPVITETVVLVAPESDHVPTSEVVTVIETIGDEQMQVQEINEKDSAIETMEATTLQTVDSEVCDVIDQATEKTDEIKKEVQEETEIEAQSMVIAQAVIQDAMGRVSDNAPEPNDPTNAAITIHESAQAVATTEKEIELSTDNAVISDVSVMVACEKSPETLCVAMEVIDTVLVEDVTSLDTSVAEEKREEELNKAMEVNVSEEIVTVEEVVEIKTESETEKDQVEEEQSKGTDFQETDANEEAEEVEPQSEEETSKAPSKEDDEKVLEIHTPVQVVLQTAQEIEEPLVEVEAVTEIDSAKAESTASEDKPATLIEECQLTTSAEMSAPCQVTLAEPNHQNAEKSSSVKCAEVMAQVIEVIEEAVKEIEPLSTEITTAS